MRDDEIMCKEFSYIPPEIDRFNNRHLGINSGFSLSLIFATCQTLLGYDDQYLQSFVNASYKAFEGVLNLNSIDNITIKREKSNAKYNYPYIEESTFFPCQYHLEILAHTQSWRTKNRIDTFIKAVNRLNTIMKEDNAIHVKIGSNYYAPLWAFVRPLKPFTLFPPYDAAVRKTITHLAMIGGAEIDVVAQSIEFAKRLIHNDGILRVTFENAYQKKCFKDNMKFPGPYSEIALETNHKSDTQIWCDLTFWAVQLLSIINPS